jgi:hypothetical protein
VTELEQLKATRALISDEAHFTKGYLARNHLGCECDPNNSTARSWCVVGAWIHATRAGASDLDTLLGTVDPTLINDTYGHKAVLKMLDRAIERLAP